ncbi:hypothetical protein B0T18DRAFT_394629 [Schizothecium vesticola]|uniref:Store-operated calcium entry-associated regulatory factor n=1 Tax=Schizothecium vesticola TaxID=314040 RepID=A0AA40EEB7_9PEZI|nr:hypothetical protein B0T18DRAFT_394629 [Schizothecium vesticola]
MQPPTHLAPLLLLLLTPLPTTAAKPKPKDAILLSQVHSLTFSSHRQTTHRRVSSIPQLKCISPARICALHPLPTLHCANTGASYSAEDITWSCTAASIPTTLRLGSTDVICEGYDSPDDPYVLRGSCGVEYRLVLSEEGERRYPDLAGTSSTAGGGEGTDWGGYLFAMLFVGVAGWMVYSACVDGGGGARPAGRRRPPPPPGGGGGGPGGWGGGGWGPGGGGGGGDAWDDPPPPYPGTKRSSTTANANAGGWGPGFWSGLAGGAAAGYMAGNRGNRRDEDNRRGRWGGGGSSWASGSGTQGGSSSSSGATHESTGFGSTSRR